MLEIDLDDWKDLCVRAGVDRRMLLTPGEEDVRERHKLQDGCVVVLQVNMGFLVVLSLRQYLKENIERWNRRSTTKLPSDRSACLVTASKIAELTSMTLFPLYRENGRFDSRYSTRSKLHSQVFRPPSYTPGNRSDGASRYSKIFGSIFGFFSSSTTFSSSSLILDSPASGSTVPSAISWNRASKRSLRTRLIDDELAALGMGMEMGE